MNHFVHCCSFSTSNKITSKECQSASQTCDFDAKNATFFCRSHPPRRLDLSPSHSEILPTLVPKPLTKMLFSMSAVRCDNWSQSFPIAQSVKSVRHKHVYLWHHEWRHKDYL